MRWILNRLQADEEGFTLIELLVVVAIIALLATFAMPRLFEAITKAKEAPGQADLQTISAALDRYFFDHNKYPTDLSDLTENSYLKKTTTFLNGFKLGYFYGYASDGAAYILIDPKGSEAEVDACGILWTPGDKAVSESLTVNAIDICEAPIGMMAVSY